MSATPGAKDQYSRGGGVSSGGSDGDFGRSGGGSGPPFGRDVALVDRGAGGIVVAGALLAALLLVVAEFTALYQVHIATSLTPVKSVSGGSNHSYAMLVIGLAAAALAIWTWRAESRTALLGLGVLGVVALLISLLGDLPDSHATGLAGSATRGYVNASSTPSAGLYMETLGAILLILACGLGFLMQGPGRGRGHGGGAGPRGPRDGLDPEPGEEPNGHGRGGNGERSKPAWTRARRS
ncbi:MAG TPA: hypothetical protein VKR21_07930 [Solirubrobacteraceae bacterium]|nr:hypothetical protein [Solirubrobacteraceae bacterium]